MKLRRAACLLLCLGFLGLFSCGYAETGKLFDNLSAVLAQALQLSPAREAQEEDRYTAEYTAFDERSYVQSLSVFLENGFEITQWRGRGKTVHVTFVLEEAQVNLECDGNAETATITCSASLLGKTLHLPVRSGDAVLFGSYEQDNDLTNGPEMIEWLVLESDRDSALLLSRYALDSQVYVQAGPNDEPSAYVSYWEDSYLRQWLNSDFLCAAFQEDELSRLMLCSVSDDPNPYYDTPPGNDTLDYIWLPSVVEMERCFPNKAARITPATAYAFAQRHITYQAMPVCALRSTGNSAGSHACVNIYGSVFEVRRNDLYSAIRPMARVRFD